MMSVYDKGPTIGKDKDGHTKVVTSEAKKKTDAKGEKGADNAGTTDGVNAPMEVRHAHERRTLHSSQEMHTRHEGAWKELHARHEAEMGGKK